ncbi:hypothetical protein [Pseudomonas sp. LB1P83]
MSAAKLFELLMCGLAYLVLSGLWFCLAAPWLLNDGATASLFTLKIGAAIWICATACIVIHVIQKARPA